MRENNRPLLLSVLFSVWGQSIDDKRQIRLAGRMPEVVMAEVTGYDNDGYGYIALDVDDDDDEEIPITEQLKTPPPPPPPPAPEIIEVVEDEEEIEETIICQSKV